MSENLIEQLPDRIETALSDLLVPNETVHVKLKGAFKEGLICTDTRVIILKGGFMVGQICFMVGQIFGTNAFQLSYFNVAGVQVKFHFSTGFFQLSASGMEHRSFKGKAPNCISLNSKGQKKKFEDACSFILNKIDEVRS